MCPDALAATASMAKPRATLAAASNIFKLLMRADHFTPGRQPPPANRAGLDFSRPPAEGSRGPGTGVVGPASKRREA